MKTKTILTIGTIIGVILLSGCVGNESNTKMNKTPISTPKSDVTISIPTTEQVQTDTTPDYITRNFSVKSENLTNISNLPISSEAEWCKPGNKKVVLGKEFTIIGIENSDLCKAELEISNGKTEYYFSQDEKIARMISSASSNNGSSYAEANSSVNIS